MYSKLAKNKEKLIFERILVSLKLNDLSETTKFSTRNIKSRDSMKTGTAGQYYKIWLKCMASVDKLPKKINRKS